MMAHEFTAVVALNINEHERYALNRELIESFFLFPGCVVMPTQAMLC
jgi:hypothetical protein